MHFYKSIPTLLSLVLSVAALPCDQAILTNSPDTSQTKTSEHVFINPTANGGLYLCENAGFRGYCVHYTEPFGRCTTINNQFPSGDRGVSAAGADRGSWCTLYTEENCHGQELQVHYPGYENLSPLGWNDRVRSFNCAAE
ncbi:hypothetical protein MYU51_005821 [Penicillium brevicompactum]